MLREDDPNTTDKDEKIIYNELAPVYDGEGNRITNGAFGDPPAIFVRINDTGENNFTADYRWVKGINVKLNTLGEPDFSDIQLDSISEFLKARKALEPDLDWPAFEERLEEMNHANAAGSRSGDIIAITDGKMGYLSVGFLDDAYPGWHGGPTVSESYVPLIFAMPGNSFVDASGNSINYPAGLADGFTNGVNAAN